MVKPSRAAAVNAANAAAAAAQASTPAPVVAVSAPAPAPVPAPAPAPVDAALAAPVTKLPTSTSSDNLQAVGPPSPSRVINHRQNNLNLGDETWIDMTGSSTPTRGSINSNPLLASGGSSDSLSVPGSISRKSSTSSMASSSSMRGKPRKPAIIVAAGQLDNPDFSGWLAKQGGSGLTLKNWRRRWFILKDFCLYYYKSPEDQECLGKIVLPSYIISPVNSEDKVSRKHAFKAHHPGMRTYWFAGDTVEHMKQWMTAMSFAAILQSPDELAEESMKSDVSIFGRNFFKNQLSSQSLASPSLAFDTDDDEDAAVPRPGRASSTRLSAVQEGDDDANEQAKLQLIRQELQRGQELLAEQESKEWQLEETTINGTEGEANEQQTFVAQVSMSLPQAAITETLTYNAPPRFGSDVADGFSKDELLALVTAQQEEIRLINEDREMLVSLNERIKGQVAALKSEMFEAFSLLQKELYEEQQRTQDLHLENQRLTQETEKQLPTLAIVDSMIRLGKAVREENKALIQMLDECEVVDDESREALANGPSSLLLQLAVRLEEEQTITTQMEDVKVFLATQEEKLESKLESIDAIQGQVAASSQEVKKLRQRKKLLETRLNEAAADKQAQEKMKQELALVQDRLAREQQNITDASARNKELEHEVSQLRSRLREVEQLESTLKADAASTIISPLVIDELVLQPAELAGTDSPKQPTAMAATSAPSSSATLASTPAKASSPAAASAAAPVAPTPVSAAASGSAWAAPAAPHSSGGGRSPHQQGASPSVSRRVSIIRRASSVTVRPGANTHHDSSIPAAMAAAASAVQNNNTTPAPMARKPSLATISREGSFTDPENALDGVNERKRILESEVQSVRERLDVLVQRKGALKAQTENQRRELVGQEPLTDAEVALIQSEIATRDSVPTLALTKRTRVDLEVELHSLRKRSEALERDIAEFNLLLHKFKMQATGGTMAQAAGASTMSALITPQWVQEVSAAEVDRAKQSRLTTEDPEKMSFRERLALFL
ncbi:hypothetical protein, variant [Capsaspora owczarzaki ATCC 30864]|nr:hypothetical protein, variant [Capsaspora owczarzaki ATCC 30864]